MLAEIHVDRKKFENMSREELINKYILLYKRAYELTGKVRKLENDLIQKQEPWI